MRKRRDEFVSVNGKKQRGDRVVLTIVILAVCVSGILYAAKLQMDAKYITLNQETYHVEEEDRFPC